MKKFLTILFCCLLGMNVLSAEPFGNRVLVERWCTSVKSIPEFETFTEDSNYYMDELTLLTGREYELRLIVNDDIENRILEHLEKKWFVENYDVFFYIVYRDLDANYEIKNGYLAFCFRLNGKWIFQLHFFD